jgi:acyl-CoA synthetase (AMP-forming)/AMP-acid ligase II
VPNTPDSDAALVSVVAPSNREAISIARRIRQLAADDPVRDFPDVISPEVNGTCSSGSTGTPKVIVTERPGIYTPDQRTTFAAVLGSAGVTHPQTILVPTAMYHTNGFVTLHNLIAGARLVVMEKFDAARVIGGRPSTSPPSTGGCTSCTRRRWPSPAPPLA